MTQGPADGIGHGSGFRVNSISKPSIFRLDRPHRLDDLAREHPVRVEGALAAWLATDEVVGLEIVGPSSWGIDVPIVVAYGFRGAVHLQLFAGPGLGPRALEELEREILDAFSEV